MVLQMLQMVSHCEEDAEKVGPKAKPGKCNFISRMKQKKKEQVLQKGSGRTDGQKLPRKSLGKAMLRMGFEMIP